MSAVGVNIRYRFAELPDALLDLVRAPVDDALADADYEVRSASTKRTVVLEPGMVNVEVKQAGAAGSLEFNFHRDSTMVAELTQWLGRVNEFVELSDRLAAVLGVANVRGEVHA